MSTIRLSRDYGLVLPPAVRSALGLKPGQRLRIRRNGDRIELVPLAAAPVRKAAQPARSPAKRRRSIAVLEEQDRAGYARVPEDRDELSAWDRVVAWPEE